MVVAIIAGKEGVGKTAQLIIFAQTFQTYKWGVLERKDVKTLNKIGISHDELIKVDNNLLKDPKKILENVETWRNKIVNEKSPDLKLIVLDGISELRRLARDEWDATPGNTKASGKNKHAWEMINNRVRRIIYPIVNYGLYFPTHVFLTAQMKNEYENDIKIGKEIDIKEWMAHDVECIIEMKKDKGTKHYHCVCDKAPNWSDGAFSVELRKDTGLLEVMSIQGLLEE